MGVSAEGRGGGGGGGGEGGGEGSKAGDEMRQRLQAGSKPAIARVSAACTGTAAGGEECIFKEPDDDVMRSRAARLSGIVSGGGMWHT